MAYLDEDDLHKYIDDDDFDDEALRQLDAIEAAHRPPPPVRTPSFDEYELFADIDPHQLEILDTFIEDSYPGNGDPVARSSGTTPRPAPHPPLTQPSTKEWVQTVLSRKGKSVCHALEGDPIAGSVVDSVQPPPMKLRPDLSAAEHWIYPLNGPKRDYQYDIVRKCLFDNTIVALPTAQGKAFIAGVVMLNFYRWFPDGKVVFVAPTKTLIANQIKACQKTGGFQDIDAVELTRANRRETRTRAWKEKRVLYMTPQIFNNDLLFGTYDAEDIILLVFDEAHKATGHYAYDKAVQFMMAKNRHFRVLALTANPGADREAVQALIDVLHISRIESRNEGSRSPDSKIYIQDENVEQHIVAMTEHVDRINDPLSRLIESVLRPLQQQNMIDRSIDAASLHSFTAEAKLQSLKTGEGEGCLKPNEGWAIRALATLSYLARAKSCLIQGTIGMCNTVIHALKRDADNEGNFSNRRQLRDDPLFKEVITELEVQGREGFSMHPKMKCMKALVLQHFAQQHRKNEPTNVMVFVAFREAVDQIAAVEEIVHVLSSERPRIRPHQFVGQGTSDSGGTGPAETEQMAILRRFRSDELNVLVATSIGEELSDIGDVGLIVCYDAQETPRILQSLGLTGRRYDGTIHILISAAREKCDMDEAQRSHKDVQKAIVCGDQFEFYGDVERLLPDHIEPQCLEMKLEIEERVRSRGRKNRPKGTKRNRNDGASSTTPDSPVSRYRSVSTPRVLRGTNKRLKVARDWEQAGRDDETDIEIQSGLIFPPAHAAPPTVLDAAMSLQRTADETHLSIVEIDSDSAPSASSPANRNPYTSKKLLGLDDDWEVKIIDSPMDRLPRSTPSTVGVDEVSTTTDNNTSRQVVASALPNSAELTGWVELGSAPSSTRSPAVRPLKRRRRIPSVDILSASGSGSPVGRRLYRRESSSAEEGHHHLQPRQLTGLLRQMCDIEAVESGRELSECSSDDDIEDESDRQFLRATSEQRATGYDQSSVYHQSLLSPSSSEGAIPGFASRPVRNGMFGGGLSEDLRHRRQISNSPARDSGQTDSYELDSFVTDDQESESHCSEA